MTTETRLPGDGLRCEAADGAGLGAGAAENSRAKIPIGKSLDAASHFEVRRAAIAHPKSRRGPNGHLAQKLDEGSIARPSRCCHTPGPRPGHTCWPKAARTSADRRAPALSGRSPASSPPVCKD